MSSFGGSASICGGSDVNIELKKELTMFKKDLKKAIDEIDQK